MPEIWEIEEWLFTKNGKKKLKVLFKKKFGLFNPKEQKKHSSWFFSRRFFFGKITNLFSLKVIYHVAPIMNPDGHRRWIGNDVTIILYLEKNSTLSFDPSEVKKGRKKNHVNMILFSWKSTEILLIFVPSFMISVKFLNFLLLFNQLTILMIPRQNFPPMLTQEFKNYFHRKNSQNTSNSKKELKKIT